MHKTFLIAAMLPLAFGPVRAQSADAAPILTYAAQPGGIQAAGHGEVTAAPDIAYLTVSVITQAKTAARATADNAAQSDALRKALRGAGIAEKDIQTQDFSVQPQYDYQANPPVLTGYQVTDSLQVTVRDLKKAGAVIDAASQGGADQIGGIRYDLTDRKAAEARALALAVQNARSGASVMADAAGVGLGRLISLTSGGVSAPEPPRPVFRMAAEAKAPTQISPQDLKITADVTAVYAVGVK